MKILGVGLSKTGTTSLHEALLTLGYTAIHQDRERLNHILDGSDNRPDFRVYDDVDAVTDIPSAYFYRELLAAYPECKAVLTARDVESWWKSAEEHFNVTYTVEGRENDPLREVYAWLERGRNLVYGSARATEFLFKKRSPSPTSACGPRCPLDACS
ncbi:MAG TPA: sulfotransferase [Pyrinomonadaceae bacterium]